MKESERIFGRRAVLEALAAGRRRFQKILLARGLKGTTFREIVEEAERRKIPIQECERKRLDSIAGSEHHQGVVAVTSAIADAGIAGLVARAHNAGEPPLILLVDGVTDPQNLGAIIRSAEAAGVHGVVLPTRHSAPMDGSTAKASAGAVEHLPVAHVANLGQAVLRLRDEEIRVFSADASVTAPSLYRADLDGPVAVVIGSEGRGVSPIVRERCHGTFRIPMSGRVQSLNAAAAAAVILFEIARRRRGGA